MGNKHGGGHAQQNQTNAAPGSSGGKEPKRDPSQNMHVVNPEIKVHTVVSSELDFDHQSAMLLPLGEVSDEQLMAEVARRNLDLHSKITDALVKESYDVGRVLGHGASGEVYLVQHKVTKQKYACKVVKRNSNMNDAQSMSTEIEIMKRIRHRHIVSMYELYETPRCLWIVLELVDGGDLHHYLAHSHGYSEVMASRHLKQLLQAVHYLHSLGVVHRDLKLDNILLTGTATDHDVKIADFGLSALVRVGEFGYDAEESIKRKKYKELTDMWGTKEYFAPEVIDRAYGPQADIWALGCILYELLTGHQAFPVKEHDTESKFYGRIQRRELDLKRLSKISPEAKSLLMEMLETSPEKRISASEALRHPWITGAAHQDSHRQLLMDVHHNMKSRFDLKKERN